MIENKNPSLYFKTYSPVTAIIVCFMFGYGIGNFIVDIVYYLTKYYN